jgi:putative transposase
LSEPAVDAMRHRSRSSPRRHPLAIPAAVEDLAVLIRKELADQGLDHGPLTVRWHLQQAGLRAPAASTLARIFTARGLVVPQPKKRPRSAGRRFSFAQAHECWQLDSFEWHLANGVGVAIYQLSDDCTRYAIASHVDVSENAAGARTVVDKGITAHQVPVLLLTDNGSAFNRDRMGQSTKLVIHLKALGTKPITGRPEHPQTQGKNERVHQTLQKWLRRHPPAADIAALQVLVDEFDQIYNHQRPHQALGMRTPAEALAGALVAIPPQPPTPTRPADPPTTQILQRHADKVGKIWVDKVAIMLGWEHAGTDIAVLASTHTLNIFTTTTGALIRTVVLEPEKTYYGNGRPRGGGSHRNRVSTLT